MLMPFGIISHPAFNRPTPKRFKAGDQQNGAIVQFFLQDASAEAGQLKIERRMKDRGGNLMTYVSCQRLSAIVLAVLWPLFGLLGCGSTPPAEVPPPPEVIVSHPLKKQVTEYLEFPGTTAALEFVEIRARVEGWLESVHFEPGSRVEKGALLFLIDPKPYQVQVDQNEAGLKGREADMRLKEANLRRAAQLLSTGSISQLQYDVQSAE